MERAPVLEVVAQPVRGATSGGRGARSLRWKAFTGGAVAGRGVARAGQQVSTTKWLTTTKKGGILNRVFENDERLSQVFAALADPTRRGLVARLTVGDATVGELAAPYAVSLQAVSKHLKVLEAAGLVSRSKDGQRRPVRLHAEVLDLMTVWLDRYRQQAEERYRRLDAVLADRDDTPFDERTAP